MAWWAACGASLGLLLGGACAGDGGAGGHGGTGGGAATGLGGAPVAGSGGFGGSAGGVGGQPVGGSGAGGQGGAVPADFREPGPYDAQVTTGSFTTTSSCVLNYDLYEPQGTPWSGLVVALHGLQCGRQHMAGFAEHWASWGLRVVAPDLCHSTLVDMDQEQNGLDAIELAASLSAGPMIYAGHSAGGLSALVAAAHDPGTLASFGLDPAEWNGIGTAAVPDITSPGYAALGVPSNCNGYGNAVPLYDAMADGRMLRVTEADHCDFSSPNTCTQCQLGCGVGTNLLFTDAEITATIRGLSTSFMLWQAGLNATGSQWWTAGQPPYDSLLNAGAISVP